MISQRYSPQYAPPNNALIIGLTPYDLYPQIILLFFLNLLSIAGLVPIRHTNAGNGGTMYSKQMRRCVFQSGSLRVSRASVESQGG